MRSTLVAVLAAAVLAACGPTMPSGAREYPTSSVCGASPERCRVYRPRPGDDAWHTD